MARATLWSVGVGSAKRGDVVCTNIPEESSVVVGDAKISVPLDLRVIVEEREDLLKERVLFIDSSHALKLSGQLAKVATSRRPMGNLPL
jgi:hypothetical protein